MIGIGAGPHTSGQVLVYHDLLGLMNHPHHEKYVPSFCKKYANLGIEINSALENYRNEVENSLFPTNELYNPYKMSIEEQEKFESLLKHDIEKRLKEKIITEQKLKEQDEYEITKLY